MDTGISKQFFCLKCQDPPCYYVQLSGKGIFITKPKQASFDKSQMKTEQNMKLSSIRNKSESTSGEMCGCCKINPFSNNARVLSPTKFQYVTPSLSPLHHIIWLYHSTKIVIRFWYTLYLSYQMYTFNDTYLQLCTRQYRSVYIIHGPTQCKKREKGV